MNEITVKPERVLSVASRYPNAVDALRELFPGVSFDPVTITLTPREAATLRYLVRYNVTVVDYIRGLSGSASWGPVPDDLTRVMGSVGDLIDRAQGKS